MSNLVLERSGRLAILRLDKPRGNAIDGPLVDELAASCRELESDDAVRGVLLASAHPRIFCPGLDLIGLLDHDRDAMRRFMTRFAATIQAMYAMPKPMVAALAGHAVAGGCVLALTADWRILRRGGVTIGLNEVRVGVPLPWSVALLLRASVSPAHLAEVGLLGRNLADEEALAAGLAHELAPQEGFEAACLARLEDLAEKDPLAFGTTKRYLRAGTLAAMRAREAELLDEFLDAWFSEATRDRVRETAASLGRPRDPV